MRPSHRGQATRRQQAKGPRHAAAISPPCAHHYLARTLPTWPAPPRSTSSHWTIPSSRLDAHASAITSVLQSSDERPQVHAVHDTDPLWLQDARARQAVGRSERDLPRKATRCRGERNDRDLRERREHISAPENEHRPSLVRCREAKPAHVASLDHGNSGSPSSVSGPSSALWSHASRARRSAALSGSSTASTITRTR